MPWQADLIDSEIFAVHVALVPSSDNPAGKVLLFGGDEQDGAQAEGFGNFRNTKLYHVATGAIESVGSPDSDVFCAGQAFLGDGRLLVGGGTQEYPEVPGYHDHALGFFGHRRCWVFNALDRTWEEVAQFNPEPDSSDGAGGGRWYPTLITMSNGDVTAFFGHPLKDATWHRNVRPERYRIGSAAWQYLPTDMAFPGHEPSKETGGVITQPKFFPRCHILPDGRMFFATPMPVASTSTSDGAYASTFVDPETAAFAAQRIDAVAPSSATMADQADATNGLENDDVSAFAFSNILGPSRYFTLEETTSTPSRSSSRTTWRLSTIDRPIRSSAKTMTAWIPPRWARANTRSNPARFLLALTLSSTTSTTSKPLTSAS